MFWADEVALELKKRKLPLEWVDDMKTPSGRIHVGALRGVVIHDLVYKALKEIGVKTKYTYVFDDHDPMDALPVYLPKEEFEKYLGVPLYKIPSPVEGCENYARYYALEFKNVFNAIDCHPQIIWATDLYLSGKMNGVIKECLDKTEIIRKIYKELYKKKMPQDWHPFQVYCPKCGKVSTTKATAWDGKEVSFVCEVEGLSWTKGCGAKGKTSPFSDSDGITGKLPWKVEWAGKWKALGVTVEGAGKDHMSRGGSHDLASLICRRVLNYPVPYPIAYEWFLIGGQKMSSSRGVGSSAKEMAEILPPEVLRFLMVKTRINQAINFDPYEPTTIPRIFDDYDRTQETYLAKSDPVLARVFELSQVAEKFETKKLRRFSEIVNLLQMPGKEKELEKKDVKPRVNFAKIWLSRFAPEKDKFSVREELPEAARALSAKQKMFLTKVGEELVNECQPAEFEKRLYQLSQELELPGKEAFSAIYLSLLGKDHGPKAAWFIFSLEKKFVRERFKEVALANNLSLNLELKIFNKPEVFSIDGEVKEKFPSVSVGVAIIKGVSIKKQDENLEKEKEKLLHSLKGLTTEQISKYPEIQSYRKLYKETGIDWHSRRPSPEALLRRIALKKGLYAINTCVDAYNLIVMRHKVSVGAFDFDKIQFPTVLRFAKEGEEILLLGDSRQTKYKEGEIAYFDQVGGFNIDFNYRDSQKTAVQLTTKNLYINVDGIYEITPLQVEKVLQETCDIIMKYCGGKVEIPGVETAS